MSEPLNTIGVLTYHEANIVGDFLYVIRELKLISIETDHRCMGILYRDGRLKD